VAPARGAAAHVVHRRWQDARIRRALLILPLLAVAGCADTTAVGPGASASLRAELPPAPSAAIAVPIGRHARFKPQARTDASGGRVGRMVCLPDAGPRDGAHLELFAAGRVVVIPRAIGVARGCSYPVRTRDRTGVVEVRGHATLGDLFAVWGAPLSPTRLLSFRGRVRAYVDGRRVSGDPRAIALHRHASIALVVGPPVPYHASYRFVPGL
jgi:hypothetical protein